MFDISIIDNNTIGYEDHNFNDQTIKIWPNPSNGFFNLLGSETIKIIQVYDITGKMIYQQAPLKPLVQIDISGHNSGIYLIRVVFQSEIRNIKIQKL